MVSQVTQANASEILSSNDWINDVAEHVGQAKSPAGVRVGQTFVIDPQSMQHGRMNFMDRRSIFDGFVSDFIGVAVMNSATDTAPDKRKQTSAIESAKSTAAARI